MITTHYRELIYFNPLVYVKVMHNYDAWASGSEIGDWDYVLFEIYEAFDGINGQMEIIA